MRSLNANSGFTLMELMISIMILCIILVIVLSGLRLGIQSWEKGEKYVERTQKYRIVLHLIERQLGSICLNRINYGGREAFFLNGDDKSIEFASAISLLPDNQNHIVYVKYRIIPDDGGKGQLQVCEKKFILLNRDDYEIETTDEDFITLITDVEGMYFQYLNKNNKDNQFEWLDTWDREKKLSFPKAIKAIYMPAYDEASISVIAAIQTDLE